MIDKLENLTVPGPTVTPITKPFWDAVARNEFILQKCEDCGKWVFYPRSHCPHCWSNHLEWKPASGNGRLKTWSVVHRPGHLAWAEVAPYVLGVVELEEGPTMLTHLLVQPNQELKIGLPLKVKTIKINDVWLPFFESKD
ncbi:Zn-ribbon domain-containing OB-fold protein [Bacillus sp. JJ1533]|uniref:Zn-ribbon domain-containing OB-fold protein n=1 Tax=Bacillus sp. JJ1533 TaxID=3122959 RepID=UPI0030008304